MIALILVAYGFGVRQVLDCGHLAALGELERATGTVATAAQRARLRIRGACNRRRRGSMLEILIVAVRLAAYLATPIPSPAPAVLDAVAWAESRDDWRAVSPGARCIGAFQLCSRFSAIPAPLAFVPHFARREAARQLRAWQARAGGRLAPALAAYRCGLAGLRGRCGARYAAAVLEHAAALEVRACQR